MGGRLTMIAWLAGNSRGLTVRIRPHPSASVRIRLTYGRTYGREVKLQAKKSG